MAILSQTMNFCLRGIILRKPHLGIITSSNFIPKSRKTSRWDNFSLRYRFSGKEFKNDICLRAEISFFRKTSHLRYFPKSQDIVFGKKSSKTISADFPRYRFREKIPVYDTFRRAEISFLRKISHLRYFPKSRDIGFRKKSRFTILSVKLRYRFQEKDFNYDTCGEVKISFFRKNSHLRYLSKVQGIEI